MNKQERDPYKELNIDPDATPADIKRAYRNCARKAHPDVGGSPTAFNRLHQAYILLSDPGARAEYDRTGQWTTDTMPEAQRLKHYAMNLLGSMFNEYLHQNGLDALEQDCTVVLKQAVDERMQGLNTQLIENTELLEVYEGARDRLTYKGSGINILLGVIDQQVGMLHKNITAIEFELKGCDAALATLTDYAFAFDTAAEAEDDSCMENEMRSFFQRGQAWGNTTDTWG